MNVTQETHDKVVKIVNDTLEQARGIWKSHAHLIRPLAVEWFNNRVKIAGLAHMSRNKVSYNSNYIDQDDFWATTIKHEVAHHIQHWIYPFARQAHGTEFRQIMQVLGCSGRTYHSMSTPQLEDFKARKRENQIEYVCPTCNNILHLSNIIHRRIQMGRVYTCNASYTCKRARKPLVMKSLFQTKEVSVKEIIPEHKENFVSTPVVPSPTIPARVVGAANLSDIIGKGWWNS